MSTGRYPLDRRVEEPPGELCCGPYGPQFLRKARPLAKLRELTRLGGTPGLRQIEGAAQTDVPRSGFAAQAGLEPRSVISAVVA